jgi:hypothetical protein
MPGDRLAEIPGEEPLLRPPDPSIVAQRGEEFRREHDVAVLAALAEMYVQGVSTRKVKAITEERFRHPAIAD